MSANKFHSLHCETEKNIFRDTRSSDQQNKQTVQTARGKGPAAIPQSHPRSGPKGSESLRLDLFQWM